MLSRENQMIVSCSICGKEVINKLLTNLHDLLFDNFRHSPLREGTNLFKAFKIVLHHVINGAPLGEGNMIFNEGYKDEFADFNWVDKFTIEDIDELAIYIQEQTDGHFTCSTCRKLSRILRVVGYENSKWKISTQGSWCFFQDKRLPPFFNVEHVEN